MNDPNDPRFLLGQARPAMQQVVQMHIPGLMQIVAELVAIKESMVRTEALLHGLLVGRQVPTPGVKQRKGK